MMMSKWFGRLFLEKGVLHTRHSSWAGSQTSRSHTACCPAAGGCCSRCRSSFCSDTPGNGTPWGIYLRRFWKWYATYRKNCAKMAQLYLFFCLHNDAFKFVTRGFLNQNEVFWIIIPLCLPLAEAIWENLSAVSAFWPPHPDPCAPTTHTHTHTS